MKTPKYEFVEIEGRHGFPDFKLLKDGELIGTLETSSNRKPDIEFLNRVFTNITEDVVLKVSLSDEEMTELEKLLLEGGVWHFCQERNRSSNNQCHLVVIKMVIF